MPKLHLLFTILLVFALLLIPSKADKPKAESSLPLEDGIYQANPDNEIFIVVRNLGDTILTENCAEYADGTACDLQTWTYFADNLYSTDNEQSWLYIYPENPENYSFSFTRFQSNGSSAFAAYRWTGPELPTNLANYSSLSLSN